MRGHLVASPIDWTGALAAGTGEASLVRVAKKPHPYQDVAVADVVASLVHQERTQLVMACGSGKTLITLWIAEARGDERVLVLVPTLLLLKQFRREWREAATLPFGDLAVCSDADTVEPDEWRVRADELGVPVTSDPAAIAAFLRGPSRRVVFATYASSGRIAETQTDVAIREADRLELTVEAYVLRPEFQPLFTPAELDRARDRLDAFGRMMESADRIELDPALISLLDEAEHASSSVRVELYRDRVAAFGSSAIPAMIGWVQAGHSAGFAIAVIEAIGISGSKPPAVRALTRLRALTPEWSGVIDNAIQRIGKAGSG